MPSPAPLVWEGLRGFKGEKGNPRLRVEDAATLRVMSKDWSNERIPYLVEGDPAENFERATQRALEMAKELSEIHASVLVRLSDLKPNRYGGQESEGATYKQLGFIAHRVGMDAEQRSEWYRIAREVPLSTRHASHIAGRLTDDESRERSELEELWSRDSGGSR